MPTYLQLRWRGPLMSLAGARIDGFAQPMPIPSLTAIAGLLGAALGYRRGDCRLDDLADGLRYGVVVHNPGTPLVDYQTADLGAIGLEAVAVDARGEIRVYRREGSVVKERAQQWRPLLADADMTLVLEAPGWDLDQLLAALRAPVFPLYLGRMSCPPSGQVGEGLVEAETLKEALTALRQARGGVVYRPLIGLYDNELVDGLVVSIPSRGRAPALFSVAA